MSMSRTRPSYAARRCPGPPRERRHPHRDVVDEDAVRRFAVLAEALAVVAVTTTSVRFELARGRSPSSKRPTIASVYATSAS